MTKARTKADNIVKIHANYLCGMRKIRGMKSASACNTNQKAGFLHKAQKKSLPKGRLFENNDAQMTCCSSHLPRTKRTKKHRERKAQSRYMPIQMESSPPWKASTHR